MENLFDLITKLVERKAEYADKFKEMRDNILIKFK